MYVHVYTMYVHVPLMYNVCTCLYIVCTCIYTVHNFNQLSQQVFGFRGSGNDRHDGKWSVVVNLYRRVCIMSIHKLTFMNVCVPCTYKCITTWTCMYNLHTFRYIHVQGTDMYVHVCAFMNMCVPCTYMSVPCSDAYVQVCPILSRWSGFQMMPVICRLGAEHVHTLHTVTLCRPRSYFLHTFF